MNYLMKFIPMDASTGDPTSSGGDLTSILSTISQVVTYVQAIGAGIIVLVLAMSAFHFFVGGQQGFEIGKKQIIGIVIGAGLLFCATAVSAVIKTMFGYSG